MLNLHKKSLHITNVQNANCVVMVPPKEFRFNEETARDNEFQHRVNLTEAEVKLETMAEFKAMVASLRKEGVQVVEFDYRSFLIQLYSLIRACICVRSDAWLSRNTLACRTKMLL